MKEIRNIGFWLKKWEDNDEIYSAKEDQDNNEWLHIIRINTDRWLGCLSHRSSYVQLTMELAAQIGDLNAVMWLNKNNFKYTSAIMNIAAEENHFEVAIYLYKFVERRHLYEFGPSTLSWAAKNGYLELVRYLYEVLKEPCPADAIPHAAANGHLDVVRYLHEIARGETSDSAILWAATNGHFEVVRYLYEVVQCSCPKRAMMSAITNGHTDIVEYFRDNAGINATRSSVTCAIV